MLRAQFFHNYALFVQVVRCVQELERHVGDLVFGKGAPDIREPVQIKEPLVFEIIQQVHFFIVSVKLSQSFYLGVV